MQTCISDVKLSRQKTNWSWLTADRGSPCDVKENHNLLFSDAQPISLSAGTADIPLTIVILFYLVAHFTFSVNYKTFRSMQRNRFSKLATVIMYMLPISSSRIFTGYLSKPDLMTNCRLSVTTSSLINFLPSLWPSHCVHPFQAASFFCKHTGTSYPPR